MRNRPTKSPAPVSLHEVEPAYASLLGTADTSPPKTIPFSVEMGRCAEFAEDNPHIREDWWGRIEYSGPGMCLDLKLVKQVCPRQGEFHPAEHETVYRVTVDSLEEIQFLGETILALAAKLRGTADAFGIPLLFKPR